jgi:hypothetical protein
MDVQLSLPEIDTSYYVERVRAESDLAFRAEHAAAAQAHMRLSALHMGRMKQLDETCSGSGWAPYRRAGA